MGVYKEFKMSRILEQRGQGRYGGRSAEAGRMWLVVGRNSQLLGKEKALADLHFLFLCLVLFWSHPVTCEILVP